MNAASLPCKFRIAVQPGGECPAELCAKLPPGLQKLFRQNPGGTGYSYIILEDEEGATTQYYQDQHRTWYFAPGFGGGLITLPFALPGVDIVPNLLHPITPVAFVFSILLAGGPGAFVKSNMPSNVYHEMLEADISRDTYESLKTSLDRKAERIGWYHTLFNNCSTAATRAARKAGIEGLTDYGFSTPDMLSAQIRRLAREGTGQDHVRAYSFEDRIEAGLF